MSDQQTQNWWQLSSIQVGCVICLPTIMIGQTLNQTYGFYSAISSIFIGNAILLFLGLLMSKMSMKRRKTTMENAKDYFTEKGVLFFSLSMVLVLLGWFAIQLNMMSLSILDLFSIESSRPQWLIACNIALGLLITVVARHGLRVLNIIADVSMPVLIATLAYTFFTTDAKVPHLEPSLSLRGVSVVIAMAIAIVIDLPTYFRHARTSEDATLSIFIIFGLALPILEVIGVETLCKNSSECGRTWLIGISGTFLSLFNLINHLEIVLDIMGILIASMGAVIIVRYSIEQFFSYKLTPKDHLWHSIAWFAGIVLGFLSISGISMTGISTLDSMIGASAATCLILMRREFYEEAYSR
jgi:cytosine permease